MTAKSQPRLENHPEALERDLILSGAFFLLAAIWAGGAFPLAPYRNAPKGTRAALLGKLLAWDHRVLTRVVLAPFAKHSQLFLLAASAAALSPLLYGLTNRLWRRWHDAATWLVSFAFILGLAYLLPGWLLPESLTPFALAWWKATAILGSAAILFLSSFFRVATGSLRAQDVLRQPNAYDLMDLSGAARLSELKRTGLLVKSRRGLRRSRSSSGRLCLGRFFDDGRPTPYFVAPDIAKLQQTLVVAPTGSGKTTSFALPWSRELPAQGPIRFRPGLQGRHGPPDPSGLSPRPDTRTSGSSILSARQSVHWNPMLEPVAGSADFVESQDAIAEAIFGEVNGGTYQYFDLMDLRILKAGVRAVGHLEAPSLQSPA